MTRWEKLYSYCGDYQQKERFFLNEEYPTSIPYVFYIHNISHRNSNRNKSQWTIGKPEERDCFENIVSLVYVYGFCRDYSCWGLHFEDGHVRYLGQAAANSPEPYRDLFIGKKPIKAPTPGISGNFDFLFLVRSIKKLPLPVSRERCAYY